MHIQKSNSLTSWPWPLLSALLLFKKTRANINISTDAGKEPLFHVQSDIGKEPLFHVQSDIGKEPLFHAQFDERKNPYFMRSLMQEMNLYFMHSLTQEKNPYFICSLMQEKNPYFMCSLIWTFSIHYTFYSKYCKQTVLDISLYEWEDCIWDFAVRIMSLGLGLYTSKRYLCRSNWHSGYVLSVRYSDYMLPGSQDCHLSPRCSRTVLKIPYFIEHHSYHNINNSPYHNSNNFPYHNRNKSPLS